MKATLGGIKKARRSTKTGNINAQTTEELKESVSQTWRGGGWNWDSDHTLTNTLEGKQIWEIIKYEVSFLHRPQAFGRPSPSSLKPLWQQLHMLNSCECPPNATGLTFQHFSPRPTFSVKVTFVLSLLLWMSVETSFIVQSLKHWRQQSKNKRASFIYL